MLLPKQMTHADLYNHPSRLTTGRISSTWYAVKDWFMFM